MAAVTVVNNRPVTPPGYEFNQKAQAKVALTRGTLVSPVADAPSSGFDVVVDKLATADAVMLKKAYMVLMDCAAGATASLGSHGEMDGYSGLTAGAPLYASAAVAGGIDTAKPAGAVERMWAVTTTRVYYSF